MFVFKPTITQTLRGRLCETHLGTQHIGLTTHVRASTSGDAQRRRRG
jgi:hypothetical protein